MGTKVDIDALIGLSERLLDEGKPQDSLLVHNAASALIGGCEAMVKLHAALCKTMELISEMSNDPSWSEMAAEGRRIVDDAVRASMTSKPN